MDVRHRQVGRNVHPGQHDPGQARVKHLAAERLGDVLANRFRDTTRS